MWSKEITRKLTMKTIQINGVLLTLIGIPTQYVYLFLLGIILLAWYYGNEYYLQSIGKKLFFENNKERNYFFIEDTGEIKLTLSNVGLPIRGANMTVKISDTIEPLTEHQHIASYHYTTFSVSIEKEQVSLSIPIVAKKRGLARIASLQITLPSLIGFGEVTLTLREHIKQECVVYPIAKSVPNLVSPLSHQIGNVLSKHSLLRDALSIEGVRPYIPTDAFRNVNWTSSLRSQQLMTNVYPSVAKDGWHLILDGTDMDIEEKELYIASVADICFQLTKKDVPFSLQANVRTTGETPFLLLPRGEGTAHLQRGLELLALISATSLTYPLTEMYHYYHTRMEQQPYVLYTGLNTLHELNNHATIFYLRKMGDELVVTPQEVLV